MDQYVNPNDPNNPQASIPNPPPFQVQRPDLSVGVCFAGGWDFFKSRTGLVYGAIFVMILFVGVMAFLSHMVGPDPEADPFASVGWQQIIAYLFAPLHIGPNLLLIRAMRGEEPDSMFVFSGLKRFFALIVAAILVQIAVVFGLVLLIVPGIIIGLGLQFASFLIVDYGMGVQDAFSRSWEMMSGYKWGLFLLMVALFFLNLLGVIAFVIGLFITAPLSMCIFLYFYTALSSSTLGVPQKCSG